MLAYHLHKQQLIPVESSATNPDELTRQLPRGLYSTFITNHGGTRVLGLTAHLDRLYAPALDVHPSASRADLRRALARLASEVAPGEARFRLLLSAADGTVYVIVQPFTPLPKEIFEHGVKVITTELTRHDPRLKDSSFITESQSTRTKLGRDIFEVLLTKDGKIYEGMTSNFYAILPSIIASDGRVDDALSPYRDQSAAISSSRRGLLHREERIPRNDEVTLVTALKGILLGVTRRAVLRLARGQGLGIVYRSPHVAEEFAEAFITSSSRGIVPVVQIDTSRVGEGRPGKWTKSLSLAYQAYVEERSERLIGD